MIPLENLSAAFQCEGHEDEAVQQRWRGFCELFPAFGHCIKLFKDGMQILKDPPLS